MTPNDLTGHVIEPELGLHVLTELADLNADFIDLITDSGHGGLRLFAAALPDEQIQQLKELSKPAVRRLTSCAFALFDLRLQDADLWRALAAGKTPKELSGQEAGVASGRVCLFTLSAMMYLRHLADVNHFFAKLSFGASPVALDVVRSLSLNRLREIPDQYPALLRSRFGQHPQAWTDLLKLARRNDTEPMLPAKILGYKHIYQE